MSPFSDSLPPEPEKRRVVFLTGTRADFGKIKSLIATLCEAPPRFDVHVFATGMHVSERHGYTVEEIRKCRFPGAVVETFDNGVAAGGMDQALGRTVMGFGEYVRRVNPHLIVVHGDRVEAMAGALVGALNNILVAHVEGGEVSGTIDEHIRHSVSKMSHLHFVSNDDAKRRLMQLGEAEDAVHVIGSPDLDILSSPNLPSLDEVRAHYEIPFERFAILAFHPVTTSVATLRDETRALVAAAKASGRNFVVIFPNSDHGAEIIHEEYERELRGDPRFRLFPSVRFEAMLVLLKHAELVLGNSSMGIHEAPFYGTPTVNVGSRQAGRSQNPSLLHVAGEEAQIRGALAAALERGRLEPVREFGDGQSHRRFRAVLEDGGLWTRSIQKRFVDAPNVALRAA